MGIKVAGSNPADVLLGVDDETGTVKYSTDGQTWNDANPSESTVTADDVLNAAGAYEEQLAAI